MKNVDIDLHGSNVGLLVIDEIHRIVVKVEFRGEILTVVEVPRVRGKFTRDELKILGKEDRGRRK